MPEFEAQILNILQSLKGDLGRMEESNRQLNGTVDSMRESISKTREEMISIAAKAGELNRVDGKLDALHDRVDEIEKIVRDNTLWIAAKKEEEQKRADRLADGLWGMGFGWLAQWIPAIALFAYFGWQKFQTPPTPQIDPAPQESTIDK